MPLESFLKFANLRDLEEIMFKIQNVLLIYTLLLFTHLTI